MIVVSITDTGLGIPPTELDTIFDEFRQSERTARRGYGGMGLGLAICRRLVEMHGGHIWAESSGEKGEGSTFTFALPVFEEEEGEKGRGGVVLVLAERTTDAEPLVAHLAERGFRVEVIQIDPAGGWVSRLEVAPGVVVLALEPSSQRGWKVLHALKENPTTREAPVLFASLGKGGGAALELDYMAKPVGTADLARALRRQGVGGEPTVLVVDDEPGVLDVHARVVEAQVPRSRVLRARDGREALALIRGERPDLVLLDLNMPEVDGFAVLEAMREEEMTRDIPVIVLTGRELGEEDMERLNRGVAAVLGKGLFSVEETLEYVEGALARRRELGSEAQRLVRRAMATIHEHYADPSPLEEIASHLGVSVRHLVRCFRDETGVTPGVYRTRYRIARARRLLEEGGKSVTEIALEVGFSTGNHLARAFRREMGVSPKAYRRGDRPSSSSAGDDA